LEISLNGIVVIVGNYGSGKTEVAINLAVNRKRSGLDVRIADLDLVNPYFRTREARKALEALGIKVVLPPQEYLHADLPILSPTVAGMIRQPDGLTLLDVGGDDAGFTVDADGGGFAIWLSIANGSEVTISRNILTGATEGITTRGGSLDNSTVLINSNSLGGNGNYGLYVEDSAVIVDATSNWWGHASGPSGGVADPVTGRIADGTGVAVSEHARFDPWLSTYQCTLTISSTGGGSVIVPGEGTFSYDAGTVVDLIAMPDTFYDFDKWTGDEDALANANAAATKITINGDYSITAEFKGFWECFVATAAYGTDTAKEIDILREFRDTVLLPNSLGARFVSLYYKTSPPIADFISQHEVVRTAVRVGFVDPIVKILTWTHDLWSA